MEDGAEAVKEVDRVVDLVVLRMVHGSRMYDDHIVTSLSTPLLDDARAERIASRLL